MGLESGDARPRRGEWAGCHAACPCGSQRTRAVGSQVRWGTGSRALTLPAADRNNLTTVDAREADGAGVSSRDSAWGGQGGVSSQNLKPVVQVRRPAVGSRCPHTPGQSGGRQALSFHPLQLCSRAAPSHTESALPRNRWAGKAVPGRQGAGTLMWQLGTENSAAGHCGRPDVPQWSNSITCPILHFHVREMKTRHSSKHLYIMFNAEFSLTAKGGANPNVHQLMNG